MVPAVVVGLEEAPEAQRLPGACGLPMVAMELSLGPYIATVEVHLQTYRLASASAGRWSSYRLVG